MLHTVDGHQGRCNTVGIHHRRPEVGDGGSRRGCASAAAGQGAVRQRDRDRACAGIGIGVGVFVSDRLDDVLVFGRGAGAADRNTGRAAARDGDGVAQRTRHAGTAARSQFFVNGAKGVVHRAASDFHSGARNRLRNIGGCHIDIADADRARVGNRHTDTAAHQEVGAVVSADGAGVQIQHRCIVKVRHRDRDRIARR